MSDRPAGYYENALWVYTDATSYAPADVVMFFVSSPSPNVACRISRVGGEEVQAHEQSGIQAGHHGLPEYAYRDGCGWPETFALEIGTDWPSGYYRVQLNAGDLSAEHFFVVRSANPGANARHVLVLATNTYQAYNSWGGKCLYGSDAALFDSPAQLMNRPVPASIVAWDRPYARCLVAAHLPTRLPSLHMRGMEDFPGAHESGLALAQAGASIWDLPAGYLNKWEHQFVAWAERAGIALDYLAQSDLDANPNALDPYPYYLSVGHDEYWSWDERDVVEAFVDAGGHAVFFSGNTSFWQVRPERGGQAMACYKFTATSDDPVIGTDRENRMSGLWSDPIVGRPENHMTGVTFSRAGYARTGYALSRGGGGYTIYRPDHWSLEGTNLYYGDVLGAESTLIGYETDGCAFRFEEGLPVPTAEDGTPQDFEIVGMAPVTLGEAEDLPGRGMLGRDDIEFIASRIFDGDTDRASRGHAMFGSFRRGKGEVFTAGTTEWAWALAAGDPFIERITHNVLARRS